jgi:hypothetical protein
MAAESTRFVVHQGQPWQHPRREFERLEDARVWRQETAPSWEISRITTRSLPGGEVG